MTIKVVLVDDHPLIRKGIRSVLDKVFDIEVVGEAGSGNAALKLLKSTRPDVIFLDIELPDVNGVELIGQIHTAAPASRVIMLSVHAQSRDVAGAMDAGASGFLTKSAEPQQLVDAVRDAAEGKTPLSAEAATQLVSLMRQERDGAAATRLTPREQEIWDVISRGATNAEAGRILFISEHTVKFHVHNILKKLGAKRRVEAIYAHAREDAS